MRDEGEGIGLKTKGNLFDYDISSTTLSCRVCNGEQEKYNPYSHGIHILVDTMRAIKSQWL